MCHIPGLICTFTSLNNTCPYMRVEKLFPLFSSFFFLVINLVKFRGLFGVLFSTRACVCVCMSSASTHFLAFGGCLARLSLWEVTWSAFAFLYVCMHACAKGECESEMFCSSWDAHTLLYHTLFFPWQKTSKSFRTEIHLVCKPDAEPLYRTSGTCTVACLVHVRVAFGTCTRRV